MTTQTKSVITKVYCWDNLMMMVFDQNGQQMPDYQDYAYLVYEAILRDAPDTALFYIGVYRGTVRNVARDAFNRHCKTLKPVEE